MGVELLAALIPVASDGVRALINRFTRGAGAIPSTPEQHLAVVDSDIKRLEALARLDKPGDNVSAWVSDIRALQRPIAVVLCVGGYLSAVAVGSPDAVELGELARMAVFYLFGDRTYMYLRRES